MSSERAESEVGNGGEKCLFSATCRFSDLKALEMKVEERHFWGDGFVLFFQKSQNGFKLIKSGGLWFWKFRSVLRFQQGYVHFAGAL